MSERRKTVFIICLISLLLTVFAFSGCNINNGKSEVNEPAATDKSGDNGNGNSQDDNGNEHTDDNELLNALFGSFEGDVYIHPNTSPTDSVGQKDVIAANILIISDESSFQSVEAQIKLNFRPDEKSEPVAYLGMITIIDGKYTSSGNDTVILDSENVIFKYLTDSEASDAYLLEWIKKNVPNMYDRSVSLFSDEGYYAEGNEKEYYTNAVYEVMLDKETKVAYTVKETEKQHPDISYTYTYNEMALCESKLFVRSGNSEVSKKTDYYYNEDGSLRHYTETESEYDNSYQRDYEISGDRIVLVNLFEHFSNGTEHSKRFDKDGNFLSDVTNEVFDGMVKATSRDESNRIINSLELYEDGKRVICEYEEDNSYTRTIYFAQSDIIREEKVDAADKTVSRFYYKNGNKEQKVTGFNLTNETGDVANIDGIRDDLYDLGTAFEVLSKDKTQGASISLFYDRLSDRLLFYAEITDLKYELVNFTINYGATDVHIGDQMLIYIGPEKGKYYFCIETLRGTDDHFYLLTKDGALYTASFVYIEKDDGTGWVIEGIVNDFSVYFNNRLEFPDNGITEACAYLVIQTDCFIDGMPLNGNEDEDFLSSAYEENRFSFEIIESEIPIIVDNYSYYPQGSGYLD